MSARGEKGNVLEGVDTQVTLMTSARWGKTRWLKEIRREGGDEERGDRAKLWGDESMEKNGRRDRVRGPL